MVQEVNVWMLEYVLDNTVLTCSRITCMCGVVVTNADYDCNTRKYTCSNCGEISKTMNRLPESRGESNNLRFI